MKFTRKSIGFALVVLVAFGFFPNLHAETDLSPVKRSNSGICHCPGGAYYEKTKNFTPFDTIEECLANGGRHPKRGQGDCEAEKNDKQED